MSFFAFQDIITSVSGILILVTLILATELDRPTVPTAPVVDPELASKLAEILRQQSDVDAQNRNLQALFASPSPEKLEADIASLRLQLAEVKKKHGDIALQLALNLSANEAKDQSLGLNDLKAQIEQIIQEAKAIAVEEAKIRGEMARLEQKVSNLQAKLLKLRENEGQLWLIPDKSATTKEPILAVISGNGAKVERFDHPEQGKDFNESSARREFASYLEASNPLNQYIVFLIKPSGIELFERLVKMARDKGFEVGFDALEEHREVHFTTPPPVDTTPVPPKPPASKPGNPPSTNLTPTAASGTNSVTPPPITTPPVPPPNTKSWWQRLLEFLGAA